MEFPKLPPWDQLPDLELYLDQVLLYVNQVTRFKDTSDAKLLTASMINNYVKHGYIEKPYKKKYHKKHIARLIAISILKHSFSIQDISRVLANLQDASDSETLYNTFVHYWNVESTALPVNLISYACQTIKCYHLTMDLSQEMLYHESNL